MTTDVRHPWGIGVAATASLVLAALSTLPSPAAGQSASGAPQATGAVTSLTVVAPRVVRGGPAPGWASGARIGIVSLSQDASFADLDLTTQAGADEFKKRVMYAALDACNQLEAKYPSTVYIPVQVNESCPDATAASALVVADQIIAAARTHQK